jgi:hypothetical protein
MPAGTELALQNFTALAFPQGSGLLIYLRRRIDDICRLYKIIIIDYPDLGPAFNGRYFTYGPAQVHVFDNAINIAGLKQVFDIARGNQIISAVNLLHFNNLLLRTNAEQFQKRLHYMICRDTRGSGA